MLLENLVGISEESLTFGFATGQLVKYQHPRMIKPILLHYKLNTQVRCVGCLLLCDLVC